MVPRSTTIRTFLAAAAVGLASVPSLAQQRGAAQGPRQADGAAARGTRAEGPRSTGARSPRGTPALAPSGIPPRNFGGVRARFPGPIGSNSGTLLDRGRPTFTPRGRMGGNEVPFPIAQPALPDRRRVPSGVIGNGRRGVFIDDDDDDFRFVVDLGGGNVWIGDDPVYAPQGYFERQHRRGRSYRRYWYPQSAYFPGTAYIATVPYGVDYNSYAATFPVSTEEGVYFDPYGNPIGPQFVAAPPLPPPRQLTAPERAQSALIDGDAEAAVAILRDHLRETPDDASAMRQLAVALLESGEPAQAVAVMVMAYDKDPTLAAKPLAGPLLFRDPEDLRAALNRAVTYANRVNTSSSWLLVATLMQAEGRDDVARRMLDRATDLGLDERIGEPLRRELRA